MAELKQPYLLSIAPELRNRIYHYALPGGVIRAATGRGAPQQPSLLRTCHQIREEAIGLYYNQIRFDLFIPDFEGARIQPLYDLWMRYSKDSRQEDPDGFRVATGAVPSERSVGNLEAWLRVYHQRILPRPRYRSLPSGWHAAATRCFLMVAALRARPWKEVRNLLAPLLDQTSLIAMTTSYWHGCLNLCEMKDEYPELAELAKWYYGEEKEDA